jgi:hypothetical protein
MSDSVLGMTDRQEALSRAYAQAVAAGAGYSTAVPDFDRDSVDLTIAAAGEARPRIDLQLKATKNLVLNNGEYVFSLSIKNYNDLRAKTQTPRLLVVLDMPDDGAKWISITERRLLLRRCAYWLSLRGFAESDNATSVSVKIPQANRFDVKSLKALMDKSRNGAL